MAGASEESKGVESLKNFERALGHVRNSVRPLTLMSREEVGTCVSAADRAKLNLQVAYGVSSLFYMFLKTQGVSPSTHPVKAELDRIRGYFGRLKQVGKPPEQRTLKVDAEASRRFINAALSSDSVWQNAKGTDPKSAQERRAAAGIGRSNPAGQPEMINNTLEAAAAAVLGTPAAQDTPAGTTAKKAGRQRHQEQRRRQQQQQQQQESVPGLGGSGSKRKHAAAAAAAAGADGAGSAAGGGAAPSTVGGTTGKTSTGGGKGGKVNSGEGPGAAKWGEGPDAVPGGSPPAVKKAKGSGRKNKKKAAGHRSW
ncbi:unnamed protein product [Pylaiella littoralis]